MTDQELLDDWALMEPTPEQRRRINTRVFNWLEAKETSMVHEWLGLIRLSPITAAGLLAVSAVAMFVASPLGLIARVVASVLM